MTRLFMLCFCLIVSGAPISSQDIETDTNRFDSLVFSMIRNATLARQKLEAEARIEIDRIDLTSTLQESQIQKLQFAARGDIQQFFEDVDVARRQFHAMQAAGGVGQANDTEVYERARALSERLNQGIFDNDSLLKKVARGCLNAEQAKQFSEREQRQQKLNSDAAIMIFLADLGRTVCMTSAQRESIVEWATKNITLREPEHSYARDVFMYEMSELPQAELRSILDEAQYKAIQKNFQTGIEMKGNLKQMGLLDDE